MDENRRQRLETVAGRIRRDIISMVAAAGSGHPGGSLSAVEILTALYFDVLRHDPGNPAWEERDRFVLSKGHACPVVYAALAEAGYFPVEELQTLRAFGSRLQGHPDRKKLPGLEASTGSLGQGLSIASGMALGFKMDRKPNRVYCLMGDGELDEGQIWEAAMTAAHYKLDNLCDTIVGRQHHYGLVLQIRAEKAFTRDEKIITIRDGHGARSSFRQPARRRHPIVRSCADSSPVETDSHSPPRMNTYGYLLKKNIPICIHTQGALPPARFRRVR